MASKEDDTLPLPVLSQELSVDVTADEDIIPTSQPQGSGCTKASKNSETSFNRSTEELNLSAALNSTIDDTLPREAIQTTLDKDKSSDFIPDTETKKVKIIYAKEGEFSCKKKLPVFSNVCQPQSDPLWDTPQVPESPALDSHHFSILNDSPVEPQPSQPQKSATEIIVNDSAETVDLEGSPTKGMKSERDAKVGEKLSFSCSTNSGVGRCEETQIFDNSSVLLLEQTGRCSIMDLSEKSIKGTASEDVYLVKTVDDSELQALALECTPPAVAETSGKFDAVEEETVDSGHSKANGIAKEEVESGDAIREQDSVIRKLDFKLAITCFVTFDTKTNKILRKFISKVHESPERHLKSGHVERFSDNTSDKRYSTSSSGSVYSDKQPFALSKRISAVSDQTDSSEDDFVGRLKEEKNALRRVPWGNEALLPLKLDELVQMSIESQHSLERPRVRSSLKPTERTSGSHSKEGKPNVGLDCSTVRSAEEVETPECEESAPTEMEKSKEDEGVIGNEKETGEGGEGVEGNGEQEEKTSGEEAVRGREMTEEVRDVSREGGGKKSVVLDEGLPVLARWTDKRYYSGVLGKSEKNDRWEVKFDDGTCKTMREDFIMPTEWLEVGALVFALVDDKYVSGQIMEIQRGEEVFYSLELDVKKQKVSTRVSDLCLTDVMAGIIREKHKPLSGTPRGKADIDFDNVLSGKRLREQRTPLRTGVGVGSGSSGARKKSSSKVKKDMLETIEETSGTRSAGKRSGGLKCESGHLAEDTVASADSPRGDQAGEEEGTPVRRTSSEVRGKTKPRTLSYESEEGRPGRCKPKSWLTPEGISIPGTSGLKLKGDGSKRGGEESGEPSRKRVNQERSRKGRRSFGKSPAATALAEKSKKKRKLEESVEDSVQKKALKKGEVRVKSKAKKG